MACGTWCGCAPPAERVAHRPRNPLIPARDGVSPSCVAVPFDKPSPWATVLDFLSERLPLIPRAGWARRLVAGDVLDDHARPLPPDAPCEPGVRLYYYRRLDDEQTIPFTEEVLFQDAHLLVVDKPHFLPVIPTGRYVQQSLLVRLKRTTGIDTLSPIHRIDRETAGLVLFSLRPQDRNAYQALFRERAVHKVYEAIAPHRPGFNLPLTRRSRIDEDSGSFFRMVESDGEANSETHIELCEVRGAWARYRLSPLTGKRHQLRVHLNALGAPIVGDQFYPTVLRGPDDAEDFAEPLRLLARTIAFDDPVTGLPRTFESQRAIDIVRGFGQADLDHLPRHVPFVRGLRDVQAFVALHAQQRCLQRGGQRLGELGLADAGLAFQQQRALQLQRQEHGGGQAAVGVVAGRLQGLHQGIDRGEGAHGDVLGRKKGPGSVNAGPWR